MGWVPSEDTYTCVIGACVKLGNVTEALRLKDEMVKSNIPMNIKVTKSLIKWYCMQGNVTTALKLFNEIVEAGFALDKGTFSLLINWCSKIGNIKKAYEIFSQMKLMDIQPTSFIFNCLLNGFLKQDLQEDANRLFDEAVEHGIANVVTYNVLLTWLCDQGKIVEASNLWDKMIVKGIAPSIVSYNSIVLGHCRKGHVDDASRVMNEILKSGLKPNAYTYTILIDGFFRKGDSEHALNLFDQMVAINGLCKVGGTSETRIC
ncbi:hypothetical protein K1719_007175 [Acacia pycnantha]|nr:hypothetical protein K1719_007175 [Acacia pycnantha]